MVAVLDMSVCAACDSRVQRVTEQDLRQGGWLQEAGVACPITRDRLHMTTLPPQLAKEEDAHKPVPRNKSKSQWAKVKRTDIFILAFFFFFLQRRAL